MKILKIDHLGVAVNSIDEGKNFFSDILGLKFEGAETVEPPLAEAILLCNLANTAPDSLGLIRMRLSAFVPVSDI